MTAARLPQPGGDDGNWGTILNDFLAQTHTTAGLLKDDTVGSTQLQDAAVSEAKLDTSVQTKLNAAAPVTSVAGRTGDVVLAKADVGLANVDNTTDVAKPVSAATQAAIDAARLEMFNKFSPLFAAMTALRDSRPIVVALCGASVTAQITSDRWSYQFNQRLQAAYPRTASGEQPIITLASAVSSAPTGTGIVTVNAAVGGTTTANYLTSTTRPQLMNLHPAIIIHSDMPANDYGSAAVTPATVKANMITQLNALDALASSSYPYVHMVFGGYYPTIGSPIAPIADFRQAMREACAGRSNVMFVDSYDFFTSIGVGSGGADPLDLIGVDGLHPNTAGHKVIADLVSRIFGLSSAVQAINITPNVSTTTLNTLTTGSAFTQTLAATGTTPITWSVVAGTLPAGLSLDSNTGVLSGTPSAGGAYSATVRATNTYGTSDRAFTGTVSAGVIVTVLTSDGFSGNATLTSRAADLALGGSSATWATSGGIYATSGGVLTHSGAGQGAGYIALPDNQDAQVSATFASYTSGVGTNIDLYRKTSGTCYVLGIGTGATLRLAKSDGTTLEDYGTAPAAVVGHKLTLRYYQGKVGAYLDDVLLSEFTDATVTRTSSAAGFSRNSGTISATWDGFIIETLA